MSRQPSLCVTLAPVLLRLCILQGLPSSSMICEAPLLLTSTESCKQPNMMLAAVEGLAKVVITYKHTQALSAQICRALRRVSSDFCVEDLGA